MTKAIFSRLFSPKCLRTSAGMVTWPLLVMVATISFIGPPGVSHCRAGKAILAHALLIVKQETSRQPTGGASGPCMVLLRVSGTLEVTVAWNRCIVLISCV